MIRREESSQDEDVKPNDNCLIGLCTGLFSAVAIASSRSVTTLIPIAVEMVIVAFRAGLRVTRMADELENGDESSDSWTYVIPDITEDAAQEILDNFHKQNVCCNGC